MDADRQLQERIMRRVWRVYLLRQVTSPALRLCAIAGLWLGLVSSVSMKHIFANALATSGLSGLARFSFYAVADTSTSVQIMLGLALLLAMWYIVDALRSAVFMQQMQGSV